MQRPRTDQGGALTKLLVTLLVLVLLATAALFVYTRAQAPLALGDATVGFNEVLKPQVQNDEPTVVLEPNGQIYVATFVRNTGKLPVTITGLGGLGDVGQMPYIPVQPLYLGDGKTADPSSAAPFHATRIDPGEGVGILLVYAVNPQLLCKLFTDTSVGSGTEIGTVPLRYTTYGMPDEQTLDFGHAIARVERPTRAQCEAALGQ